MEKDLILHDEAFLAEFMEIFSIGLLECLKEQLIDTARAEQWLFSPVIAYSMHKPGFNKPLIEAMRFASELNAVEPISDYYTESLQQARALFIKALQNTEKQPFNPMDHIIKNLI